jgi:hypothetical protein
MERDFYTERLRTRVAELRRLHNDPAPDCGLLFLHGPASRSLLCREPSTIATELPAAALSGHALTGSIRRRRCPLIENRSGDRGELVSERIGSIYGATAFFMSSQGRVSGSSRQTVAKPRAATEARPQKAMPLPKRSIV